MVFDRAPQVARHRSVLSSHYGTLAEVHRKTGRAAESAEMLRLKQGLWPKQPQMLFAVACDLAATAEIAAAAEKPAYLDEAMATLKQAVDAGFRDAGRLRNEPRLKGLRARPEFESLLKSVP
jgi:hypothetical protein